MEHPEGRPINASTYNKQGCRCDGCRTANSARQRGYRQRKRDQMDMKARRVPKMGDRVWVTCWCERVTGKVLLERICAGDTFTCKHPECAEIRDQHTKETS